MQLKSTKKRNINRKTKKTKVKQVEILTDIQKEKINFIKDSRNKAIIQFLLNTGMRVSEFINLNYGDLFEDIRKKQVKNTITITGKANKERHIPLNQVARQAILMIDIYNRNNLKVKGINRTYPLLISRQATRLSRQQIFNITKKELGTHPHILRHTFFTDLKKSGVAGEIIQKIAGHTDYNTTIKYYLSVSKEDLHNAVKQVDTSISMLKLAVNN